MNKVEIRSAVYQGKLVDYSEDQYKNNVRRELQEVAGDFISAGDGFRGCIALEEVKRLDKKFNYKLVGEC